MRNQFGWTKFNLLYMFIFIGIIVSPAMANYQSQEGRWMQQDPMQYVDGLNLYEYVKCNPIIYKDPFGLWYYAKGISERIKERMVLVKPYNGQSMYSQISKEEIAGMVRLDLDEFDKWAEISEDKCGYMVPNTAYIHRGDVSGWEYFVELQINDIEKFFHSMGYFVVRKNDIEQGTDMSADLGNKDIVAWAFGGHGVEEGELVLLRSNLYSVDEASKAIHHKIAYVILYACYAGQSDWKPLISQYGALYATKKKIHPWWDYWDTLPVTLGWE